MTTQTVSFEAHHSQMEVLAADARFKVLVCGRRWGKDHLAAIQLLSHSLGHISPRGAKLYAYLNPVYNPQGKDSFRVFVEFCQAGGLVKKLISTPPMEVHLINGDIVKFFSMDQPDNLRGGQYDGIIVNEAGLVPDLEELWSGPVAAMLLDRRGWAMLQGTPKGKNAFFRFFLRGLEPLDDLGEPNPWRSFRFPTHANPFIPGDELRRLEREVPAQMYSQEYLAEFVDDAGAVFRGLERLRKLSEGWDLQPQADFCRVGIDVARHHDWSVLTALDPQHRLVGFDRFKDLDWAIVERRIEAFLSRYRGKVVIDSAGAGDPLYERLVQKGIPVVAAKFTNERKTLWVQNLMLQIEEGLLRIPLPGMTADPARDTRAIWNELEAYTYELTPHGKIRYGAPQGFHDDCVTALFLAASEMPPLMSGPIVDPWFGVDLNRIREIGVSETAL